MEVDQICLGYEPEGRQRHKHDIQIIDLGYMPKGDLTLNIPSLARQLCLPNWGPRRTPFFFFVISQLFDAVDYSNYVCWVSETIIQ